MYIRLTFIELEAKYKGKQQLPTLDRHQPSQENHGMCKLKGCRGFRFFSDHDEDRHLKIVHGGKRAIANAVVPPAKDNPKIGSTNKAARKSVTTKPAANVKCQFPNCDKRFTTAYQLNQHKKMENHMAKRGRKMKK